MVIFSENKLIFKVKGKAYICLIIILFLFILLFLSVHLVGFASFLFFCVLPKSISSFSAFVDYFSEYAEDKKSTYRKAASATFYEFILADLKQEMEISYELIDSVALYVLWLALITIALMFFFIYLGIPYSC
jgi:small-conductance mechanosensitive channel